MIYLLKYIYIIIKNDNNFFRANVLIFYKFSQLNIKEEKNIEIIILSLNIEQYKFYKFSTIFANSIKSGLFLSSNSSILYKIFQ